MPWLQLPPLYYHDHFLEMLDFVGTVCGDCLTDDTRAFIVRLHALPQEARCLYIRMANRKGQIFHRRQLAYAELGEIEVACEALIAAGLARPFAAADTAALVCCFTKAELTELCQNAELISIRPSWPKAKLQAAIAGHFTEAVGADLGDYWTVEHYLVRCEVAALDYILFLYFGRTDETLKTFALRDLGIVEATADNKVGARFDDAAEAQFCFACRGARTLLDTGDAVAAAALLARLPPPPTEYAALQLHRAGCRVGQALERAGDAAGAITLYRQAGGPECRERLIRLLYAAGERAEAKALLEAAIDDPDSDLEFAFANDFYRRKFGGERISALTSLLRQSDCLTVDDTHRGAPEFGLIAAYRREGWRAYFTENHFWHQLFSLIFWDELFGPTAARGNAFDRLPLSLVKRSFRATAGAAIDAKLAAIAAGKGLLLALRTVSAAFGQPNGLFDWSDLDIEAVTDFLQIAPAAAQARMLEAMAADFMAHRDGFPDLMLARDGMLKFVEVKAEGDSIRRNQLARLRQLQAAGLTAEIARVAYRYDPAQTYVVVDIETTGSRAAAGGITEIGAVKIRGNEVIGEWHSLINPQRRIPAFITQLTGISDAMVQDAPCFAEIADELAAFLEDTIFVAHSVNFDYGFIAAAFARHGRAWRAPKLCTVVGMRRHYPGHASYSLGNLCQTFRIELVQHHRALADARATVELLRLINKRRLLAADEPNVPRQLARA